MVKDIIDMFVCRTCLFQLLIIKISYVVLLIILNIFFVTFASSCIAVIGACGGSLVVTQT